MADEFFYGVTLKSDVKETVWNPQDKEDDEGEYPSSPANKLIIKQILLGVEAKDEFSVVEVETIANDKTIKIPIAILKPGETRYANLFLEFPDAPVTFRLTQGSGPVHIHGQHLVGEFEGELDELDEEAYDEEDSDNEIRADDDDEPKAKKMKKDLKKEKNNKKK